MRGWTQATLLRASLVFAVGSLCADSSLARGHRHLRAHRPHRHAPAAETPVSPETAQRGEAPAASRAADEPRPCPAEPVERLETVAVTQPIDAPESVLGRMHPALVHLPIGWLLALWLCEVAYLLLGQFRLRGAGPYLACASVLGFLPAIVTGLLRASDLTDPLLVHKAVQHRNILLMTFCLVAVAAAIRLHRPDPLPGAWRLLYLFLLTSSSLSLGVGAHLGAQLVFGEGYLPF